MSNLKVPLKQLIDTSLTNLNNDDLNANAAADDGYLQGYNLNYTTLANTNANNQTNTFQMRNTSPNMNSNNVTFRQMMHRPSVRSISETPNVIGAQAIDDKMDICTIILTVITWISIVMFFPFSFVLIFRVVQEYER